MDQYKYLLFSGGGINGVLHLGALQYLSVHLYMEKQATIGSHFSGFGGSSIGAFIALLCVLDVPVSDMIDIFQSTLHHFEHLNLTTNVIQCHEKENFAAFLPVLCNILIERIQDDKVTFADLKTKTGKDLVICALNLCSSSCELFRAETTPDVPIVSAIMASMSVPFVFPAVQINGIPYSDGGLVLNLPVTAFPIRQTLGLWAVHQRQNQQLESIRASALTYIFQVLKAIFYTHDEVMHAFLKDSPNFVVFKGCTSFIPNGKFKFRPHLIWGSLCTCRHLASTFTEADPDAFLFTFMVLVLIMKQGRGHCQLRFSLS